MQSEVASDPYVVRLARRAPRKIAGHTSIPRTRKAASAMPAGGQIALALGCTIANPRPSLAAARYTPARAARVSHSVDVGNFGSANSQCIRLRGPRGASSFTEVRIRSIGAREEERTPTGSTSVPL